MAKKSVKLYTKDKTKVYTDNVIEAFYDALRNNSLDRLHIPHSDVFYVRQAVEAYYGRPFTLEHVEWAMRMEGWTDQQSEGSATCVESNGASMQPRNTE